MKNLIIATLAILVIACSPKSSEDVLTKLTTERDSLKEEYRDLGKKLAEVEMQMALLDTTRKLVNVTIEETKLQSFSHYFKVYGGIHADNNTIMYPSASGDIVTIAVEEGQSVKKGQLLIKIDSDILEKNIEEVKTQRSLAKDIYDKQKKLWDKNIGSEIDYLKAKNNVDALDSKLATLKTQLRKTNMVAPFSGTIDQIFVNTGQLASPQVPILRIINLSKVYLKADIPETYIKTIAKGTQVKLSFPSIGLTLDTKIDETGKFINPANRTFLIRVNLDNNNNQLYPNLLGMLEIQDYGNDSAVVIPSRLIQQDAVGNSFLFVVNNDNGVSKSEIRNISSGMTYNGETEIIEGLKQGDLIIDKGSRNVSNGQLIDVKN